MVGKLVNCVICATLLCSSCATSQHINVKQTQDQQTQEIEIEHTGKIENLAVVIGKKSGLN